MTAATCMIDGFGPIPMVRPSSVAELAEVVRAGGALYPVGGGTELALGAPPSKPGQAVDLRSMCDIVDYPARDMTVTVQAGITIQALREILVREKLHLPIDVPQADRATLGGILATNVSGPRRYGYGTLRDYVIGINALNDEGNEFKAGGRVVKNVAGYDLCKLLIGSLGTLGVITQATLKLRPLPEEQALISLTCAPDGLDAMLTCLSESRTRPVCLDLLNRTAAHLAFATASLAPPDSPWVVLVGYEGNADAVSWEVQQLVKEVGVKRRIDARIDSAALPLWDALVELGAREQTATTFKANLLPSAVAAFCVEADREAAAIQAHAGNGIVLGHWRGDLTKDRAASILTAWQERARAGQGGVIVTRCPSEWKQTLSVWGTPADGAWLMREIKTRFDPRGVFNPGRFVV